jgi:hypothetical protein
LVRRVVQVRACGESFRAEVEISVAELDQLPDRLTGKFTVLPSKTKEAAMRANFLLHTNRINDGSSHTIWFNDSGTEYRFSMTSRATLDFTAERM